MSNIEITLDGGGIRDTFHNDWDQCEARGLLHIENLEGWLGGVGASVTPDINRFRRHGKFPGRTIRSARKMDLTLTWHRSLSPDDPRGYMTAARIASGIAWDEGPYRMTVNEDGFELSAEVQLDGEPAFQPIQAGSTQAFRMRIPLRANDPFLYSPPAETTISGSTQVPVAAPQPFSQGLYDRDGNQVFAWTVPTYRPAVLRNDGTADAYPIIELVADDPRGAEIVIEGGTVQYAAPIYAQSPVLIDYKRGSATVNGRDASFNLRKREWRPIPPHSSTQPRLNFLSESGRGFGRATVRSAWI